MQRVGLLPSGMLSDFNVKTGLYQWEKLQAGEAWRRTSRYIDKIRGGIKARNQKWKGTIPKRIEQQFKAYDKFAKTKLKNDVLLRAEFDLSTWYVTNAPNNMEAMTQYLNLLVPYVNNEVGGIIGDAIKERFFTEGYGTWAPLSKGRIREKIRTGINPDVARKPNHGHSVLGLPYSWQKFTYRWGGYGARGKGYGGLTRGTDFGGKYAGGPGVPKIRRMSSAYPVKGKHRGGFVFDHGPRVKGFVKEGTTHDTIRGPGRGRSLMDVTATLVPWAYVSGNAESYAMGLRNVASNPGIGKPYGWQGSRLDVSGVLEPYMLHAPIAFYQEMGVSGAGEYGQTSYDARPWIAAGLADGINRSHLLYEAYITKTFRKFEKAMVKHGVKMYMDSQRDVATYMMTPPVQAELWRRGKIAGIGGFTDMPTHFTVDHRYDVVPAKHTHSKGLMNQIFSKYGVWWFLPPTKYWHYLGLAADIRGVFRGHFFSAATIAVYLKQLAKGLLAARAGSPVGGTRKAFRRKFRKQLYTRAGYHRKGR